MCLYLERKHYAHQVFFSFFFFCSFPFNCLLFVLEVFLFHLFCFNLSIMNFHLIASLLLLLSPFNRVRLCDPIDSSPSGPTVPGVLQARVLEWVAIAFSTQHLYQIQIKDNTTLDYKSIKDFNSSWDAADSGVSSKHYSGTSGQQDYIFLPSLLSF